MLNALLYVYKSNLLFNKAKAYKYIYPHSKFSFPAASSKLQQAMPRSVRVPSVPMRSTDWETKAYSSSHWSARK